MNEADDIGPRGRIFQNSHAESDLVQGQILRELVGFSFDGNSPSSNPSMVFLRTDEPFWHRMFLDVGAGFWEERDGECAFEDFEDAEPEDLAARHGLAGIELGTVIISPVTPDGNSAIHLHFANCRKLTLAPVDSKGLYSDALLTVGCGDVESTYLDMLELHDEPNAYERPSDFDHSYHERRVKTCCEFIARELKIALEVDDQVQDASFILDLIVKSTQVGQIIHQQSVRFSNFGNMATVTDPDVDPATLQVIREVLRSHDFMFVPPDILVRPYDGALPAGAGISTWWIRYFDYQ